jgi:hypothetical protein
MRRKGIKEESRGKQEPKRGRHKACVGSQEERRTFGNFEKVGKIRGY